MNIQYNLELNFMNKNKYPFFKNMFICMIYATKYTKYNMIYIQYKYVN